MTKPGRTCATPTGCRSRSASVQRPTRRTAPRVRPSGGESKLLIMSVLMSNADDELNALGTQLAEALDRITELAYEVEKWAEASHHDGERIAELEELERRTRFNNEHLENMRILQRDQRIAELG